MINAQVREIEYKFINPTSVLHEKIGSVFIIIGADSLNTFFFLLISNRCTHFWLFSRTFDGYGITHVDTAQDLNKHLVDVFMRRGPVKSLVISRSTAHKRTRWSITHNIMFTFC